MRENQGGDNCEKILRIESQTQLLVNGDLTKALQNRKNFHILEDESPSKSFLNLENSKSGYNKVMLIKKEDPNYNPDLQESKENAKHIKITDSQGMNED